MKLLIKFIFFIIILFLNIFCKRENSYIATKGILDLSNVYFQDSTPKRLDGEWEFYWNQLLKPEDLINKKEKLTGFIKLPGVWNGYILPNQDKIESGHGFASFRLKVKLPKNQNQFALKVPILSTAHKIWINGEFLYSSGKVGINKSSSEPKNVPYLIFFNLNPQNKKSYLDILIQVSNFHIFKGGARISLYIGNPVEILKFDKRQIGFDLFLFGSLLIMGIYHFGLFILRREDKAPLYFGFFCVLIAIRTLFTGERFFSILYPNLLSWEMETKIDFLTICISPVLFMTFIRSLFKNVIETFFVRIIQIIGVISSILVSCSDANFYSNPIQNLLILYLIGGLYCLIKLIYAAFKREDNALLFFGGFLMLVLSFGNDILYANEIINTSRLVPFGLFLFIFSQSFLLSIKFAKAFRKIEKMSASMLRFVPQDFLNIIERNSIEEIGLGDHVEKEMTVLFSDIRDFTSLSERMSPKENFEFLNTMLESLGPIIRNHNGFIDKYIGDGIMALFPSEPEDALKAAIQMNHELDKYNEYRIQNGLCEIEIGIGIHTGNLILGTIGEKQRIEGTVISDSVNLASRIEGLTKTFGVKILLSEYTFSKIKDKKNYSYRMLGKSFVKGKKKAISVYEVFDGDSSEVGKQKYQYKKEFELAVKLFLKKEYKLSEKFFRKIKTKDNATLYYLNKIKELKK